MAGVTGTRRMLQLLCLLLGMHLLAGTPVPTNDPPRPDVTPSPESLEDVSKSIPSYKEPEVAEQSPDQSVVAQPVISISERVQVKPKDKKDLGILGYVLGVLMVVIIVAIGSGIVVGYIYKRGRDLKRQHDQQVEERRLQRINLPLSAFLNPTCDIVDENSIEVLSNHTPNTAQDGVAPLMGCAGTPGA
ncbi:phosphoinositide-3-kinase-interacting protein 1 [Rhinophrynus dorsalis]